MKTDIHLSQLVECFEGIVPSLMCTHDTEFTPNISYLSHVEYLSENRIALSNQFFNKTKRNVLATGKALLLLLHPATLQSYELRLKFINSEVSGELFERMSYRLALIAAQEGQGHVFELLSSDIYEVESIKERANMVKKPWTLPSAARPTAHFAYEEAARSFLDICTSKNLDSKEAIELLLKTLRFGLGYLNSHIYLVNSNFKYDLFTSSEIRYEDVNSIQTEHYATIQKVAHFCKPIVLAGLSLQRRYFQSVQDLAIEESPIKRLIAMPLQKSGIVKGVLLVEDHKDEPWDESFARHLKMMASSLSLILGDRDVSISADAHPVMTFHLHQETETLFANQTPIIKNLPAKILYYILKRSAEEGAETVFSNQEVICALHSDFPLEGKVNFEARLSLVKKRLEDKGLPMRIVSKGRGQFVLILDPNTHFKVES